MPISIQLDTGAGVRKRMREIITNNITRVTVDQDADMNDIKKQNGQYFIHDYSKRYVDGVRGKKTIDDQSKVVITLHTDSVNRNF